MSARKQHGIGILVPIPEATRQVLRGCSNVVDGKRCSTPHPLVMRPKPADVTRCPVCGASSDEPGDIEVDRAELGGVYGWTARGFFWIAQKLVDLAKRL